MSANGSPALLPKRMSWKSTESPLPSLAIQIKRFLCIGGASVAVDLLVYMLLLSWLSTTSAKGLSFVCGMLIGFVGNKFWTFESRRKTVAEPATYVLLYSLTLCVNLVLNALALQLLSDLSVSVNAGRIAAFLIATGATTVINFVGLKFVTFRNATGSAFSFGVRNRNQKQISSATSDNIMSAKKDIIKEPVCN